MKTDSRSFRKFSRPERVQALVNEGLLTPAQAQQLLTDTPILPHQIAENMIENVIGVFGLPVAIVPGLLINGKTYDVPMVIEEPSVVAAQGNSGKVVRLSGGYTAGASEPIMIGQVQLLEIVDMEAACERIRQAEKQILAQANAAIAGIVKRGGGAKALALRPLQHPEDAAPMLVVHIHIDVREAMGANAVNTAVERCAPLLEELSGGRSVLKILSNLTDLRRAWAECAIDVDLLAVEDLSGEYVAKGIEAASKLAEIDPYRAATHNKGAMNGIDAVLIATGNDFRAVEAGAHAWAARNGIYGSLTTWRLRERKLHGRIELPLALGIVGGQVKTHPWVPLLLKMLNVTSAAELSQVIAAVGLGQNLGALRAMASVGIQAGHMAMHARTLAMEVGAIGPEAVQVAEELRRRGQIDRATAEIVLQKLRRQ